MRGNSNPVRIAKRGRLLACVTIVVALMLPVALIPATAAEPGANRALIFGGHNPLSTNFSGFAAATGAELDTLDVLPADLSSYACVVLPGQSQAFTAGEIDQLTAYMNSGGTVIALAENQAFVGTINAMNGLLTMIGADIAIQPGAVFSFGATTMIDPNSYTTGVASIMFAGTSTLAVGPQAQALVRVWDGRPFIGAQQFGQGLLAVSGDMNVFYTHVGGDFYANEGNRVLATNLCQFRGSAGPQPMNIDLKPYGTPTTIVAHSNGTLQLAVFGDADFDVADLDPASLQFGPEMAAPEEHGRSIGKLKDVNHDGFTDLSLKFKIGETGIQPGNSEICLSGALIDGTEVAGCAAVIVKH